MKLIKKFFILINLLIVAFTYLAYLNVFIEPSKFFIFPVLGLFYPILFFLNCFFIIFWIFQDVKWMLPSVIVLLIGWSHIAGFIGLNNKIDEFTAKDLTIVSYNTHLFREAKNTHGDQAYRKVATYFSEMTDLDIICFQEFNALYEEELLYKLKGFDLIRYENKKAVILSKYPKVQFGQIDFGTRTNSCVWADVLVGRDTVRIYSIHLQSSKISHDADQVLDNIDLQEKDTWKGALDVLTKYRGSAIKRTLQAKMIRAHMEACQHPIILAGDFNEPPTSYTYQLMSKDLNDCFREKGEGMTRTYGGRIPFLRIDYIMTSNQIDVLAYNTMEDLNFSDHFPVKAVVRLP